MFESLKSPPKLAKKYHQRLAILGNLVSHGFSPSFSAQKKKNRLATASWGQTPRWGQLLSTWALSFDDDLPWLKGIQLQIRWVILWVQKLKTFWRCRWKMLKWVWKVDVSTIVNVTDNVFLALQNSQYSAIGTCDGLGLPCELETPR